VIWSRAALSLSGLALTGCSCGPSHGDGPLPDWRGPAVHCRHAGDGGLTVELTAPTAGHRFELKDVVARERRVDVVCSHTPPQADFVAQVVTEHRLDVAAERLGDARVVWVWVASGGAEPKLAIATARP
jgi:hypothetical protein